MDWSSIVYGVLGGGAGVAIGLLLGAGVQKLRSSQIEEDEYDRFDTGLSGVLAGGLAFAGIMLLPSFYKDMMLPRIMPMDTSQHFASMPIYETLKHQSPDDFRQLMKPLDHADRNQDVSADDLNKVHAAFAELITAKKKRVGVDVIRNLEYVSRQQTAVFKAKAPNMCSLTFHGVRHPAMGDMFSADDIRLEQEAMAKIFTDAPRSVQFSPDLERGKALFDQIFANGVSALDITNLQPAITENNENMPEHRKMCDLLTLLSVKKSALNDADLLNLTDYLSSVGVG